MLFVQVLLLFLVRLDLAVAIWPAPESVSTGKQTLWIADDIEVTYNGGRVQLGLELDAGSRTAYVSGQAVLGTKLPVDFENETDHASFDTRDAISQAVSRALDAILVKNFVPWKLYPRNGLDEAEPKLGKQSTYITHLDVSTAEDDGTQHWKTLVEEADESYTLQVDVKGRATIHAKSYVGVVWALESFTQLFYKHSRGGIYTTMAPIDVKDRPRFPHRGVLLDVCRNWYSVDSILRALDAMSLNKLNRLHLHITDSQAWPLEIPSMPEIAEKGAYGAGLTYSPEDIANIQQHALERGIQVIVEMDAPGHTGSLAYSHPEVITGWDAAPWPTYCAEPPCGQFKLNDSRVDNLLDKLMGDLLPRLAPYTAHFHTGGDEVNFNEYLLDPSVVSSDPAVIEPLLQAFTDRNHARVRKAGLTPMVWEEIPKNYHVKLGEDVVVQSWLGGDAIKWLTSRGHKVVDSNYNFWYLDCGRGHWLNFANGAAFQTHYPFPDWCDPYKGWRLIYSHDPLVGLTEEEAKLVLGGEVAVWSETIDEQNLDSILWPRASAMGEVLWSGRRDGHGRNRSQMDAAPRLADLRERMVARGVRADPVQMVFCTQGRNASACELP